MAKAADDEAYCEIAAATIKMNAVAGFANESVHILATSCVHIRGTPAISNSEDPSSLQKLVSLLKYLHMLHRASTEREAPLNIFEKKEGAK